MISAVRVFLKKMNSKIKKKEEKLTGQTDRRGFLFGPIGSCNVGMVVVKDWRKCQLNIHLIKKNKIKKGGQATAFMPLK